MLRFRSPGLVGALGLIGGACGCMAIAFVTATACVVAPPGQLAQLPPHRPTILHDAVYPPTDQILTEMPTEFLVPVELDDPDQSFWWDVFVDYNPCNEQNDCQPTAPTVDPTLVTPTPGTLDGGVVIVPVPQITGLDPTVCHRIDFLVANQFTPDSPHTWDSIGGDIVTWFYNSGGGPNGCPLYDAGAFQNGAFPPADAAAEGLPVVPDSGGDP
jgi:hypothetical protein